MSTFTLLVSEGLLHVDVFPALSDSDRTVLENSTMRIRPQAVVEHHLRNLLQDKPYTIQTTLQPLGPELE